MSFQDQLVNECLLQYKLKDQEMYENDPWDVKDTSEFLRYHCPECEGFQLFKSLQTFSNHAIKEHPRGKAYFQKNFAPKITKKVHKTILDEAMAELQNDDYMNFEESEPNANVISLKPKNDTPTKSTIEETKAFRQAVKDEFQHTDLKRKFVSAGKVLTEFETLFYDSLANYMEDKENQSGFILKLDPTYKKINGGYDYQIVMEAAHDAAGSDENILINQGYMAKVTESWSNVDVRLL